MSAGSATPGPDGLRERLYPWALGLVTGLDYFDSTLFSFFSRYIAGGVSASPDELVWASSAYAVAAVLGILQQQWWVERVGHRSYIAGCMLFYALGAVLAAGSENALQLMLARGLQGYLIGPMMGACRILIQGTFSPQRKPQASRLFLRCIIAANSLAPLLVSRFEWRALFLVTVPAALVFGALSLVVVPDTGRLAHGEGEPGGHLWSYLAFAVAQGALQIVLQQLHFQLFTASPPLIMLTLLGFVALLGFGYHQWHHPHPMVKLATLRDRVFLVGLTLYAFYYYLTTAFSYLSLSFLEGSLDYPIENAGSFIGLTSFASLLTLYVYFRYSARLTRKKLLIASGFGVAALTAWLMLRLPPDTSQSYLVLPMLLRGVLVMFIAIPVANLSFRTFEIDDFAHSYRLKNIVRQLVVSFATSSIIVLEQHRQALHYTRLAEHVSVYAPQAARWLANSTQRFIERGHGPLVAHDMAVAEMARLVTQQADALALLDGFSFLVGVALVGGAFSLWQRQIR